MVEPGEQALPGFGHGVFGAASHDIAVEDSTTLDRGDGSRRHSGGSRNSNSWSGIGRGGIGRSGRHALNGLTGGGHRLTGNGQHHLGDQTHELERQSGDLSGRAQELTAARHHLTGTRAESTGGCWLMMEQAHAATQHRLAATGHLRGSRSEQSSGVLDIGENTLNRGLGGRHGIGCACGRQDANLCLC